SWVRCVGCQRNSPAKLVLPSQLFRGVEVFARKIELWNKAFGAILGSDEVSINNYIRIDAFSQLCCRPCAFLGRAAANPASFFRRPNFWQQCHLRASTR